MFTQGGTVADPPESLPLLNITKAAERLGVTRKTVYHWIFTGDLAVVKMGNRNYIAGAEVERVLRARDAS